MKTLEFKAYLTPQQSQKVELWLKSLRWVWNKGLALLNEYDLYHHSDKRFKSRYRCSPVGWQYHWTKDGDGWKTERPYCSLNYGQRCLLPEAKPELDADSFFSLSSYFAAKNHEDKLWFIQIPSVFVRGTLKSLIDSWKAWKSGVRKRPRRKRPQDTITTLINSDAKSTRIEDRTIGVAKLGKVRADRSIAERWPTTPVSVLKICKKADGHYVQLTGDVGYDLPEPTDLAIGLDLGAKFVVATSEGETIDPPRYYRDMQLRLARFQRQLSRQQKDSSRYKQTQKKIAKLHKKIADQRKYFNHSLSTQLVSKSGAIAVEDIQLQNLTKRAKPKKREDGKGYERNGATAKSGLTKAMLDNGLGQFRQFLEAKCNATGREFVSVPAAYTSQDCSGCGARVKKSLSTRTHTCPECGLILDRDINAAYNILARGEKLFKKSYRACSRKVTGAERTPIKGLNEAPINETSTEYSNHTIVDSKKKKTTSEPCVQLALELDSCY